MVKIDFRCNNEEKEGYKNAADKNKLSLSEFIRKTLNEKVEIDGLVEGERKFLDLFETAFKLFYEPYHDKLSLKLYHNAIDVKTIIEQNNIFYKQVDMPQERDEVKVPLYNHPITDLAKEKVFKEIKNKVSKEGIIDD